MLLSADGNLLQADDDFPLEFSVRSQADGGCLQAFPDFPQADGDFLKANGVCVQATGVCLQAAANRARKRGDGNPRRRLNPLPSDLTSLFRAAIQNSR